MMNIGPCDRIRLLTNIKPIEEQKLLLEEGVAIINDWFDVVKINEKIDKLFEAYS